MRTRCVVCGLGVFVCDIVVAGVLAGWVKGVHSAIPQDLRGNSVFVVRDNGGGGDNDAIVVVVVDEDDDDDDDDDDAISNVSFP